MISSVDKERLLSISSNLNFKSLADFIESLDINVSFCELKYGLGFSAYKKCFLNIDAIIDSYSEAHVFFIILHEIGHCKRIDMIGEDSLIEKFSNKDFDSFSDFIINEEIIADRYSSMLFYIFNGFTFPKYKTQDLENPDRQKTYKKRVVPQLYGKFNSKEAYNNFLNELVVNY